MSQAAGPPLRFLGRPLAVAGPVRPGQLLCLLSYDLLPPLLPGDERFHQMGPTTKAEAPTEVPADSAGLASAPLRGPGLLARVGPFAAVAVVAEASLALPPGPTSAWPVLASVVLLAVTAAGFALPWSRLPDWMTVLVPLAYLSSVLALLLAAGATSGVGIVILIPLVWTALFQRRWESACVVAAIVAVEVVVSLTPTVAPGAVIVRRVLLWAALGVLISVATHGLRYRLGRSRDQAAALERQLLEATVQAERERIAIDLRDQVIQRVFAAGLALQSAAASTTQPQVRRRIESSVDDLDQAVRILRDAVFDLEPRRHGRGLRQEILDLCSRLSPAPEISFTGPVDGALHPSRKVQLVELLRESLGTISGYGQPLRIEVTAETDFCLTVIDARPAGPGGSGLPQAGEFADMAARAVQAGASMDIRPTSDGTRFAWEFPLS